MKSDEESPELVAKVSDLLPDIGLVVRGGFSPNAEDQVPPIDDGIETKALLLIGNVNQDMWPSFQATGKLHADEDKLLPNPLNTWIQEIIQPIAEKLSARAVYPSDGPPYYPFLSWARRAESVSTSPLGLTIHPDYGLWHAYRAALLFSDPISFPSQPAVEPPCRSCIDQPCLKGCSVGAFSEGKYNVPKCFEHLTSGKNVRCMKVGCLARHACPVGIEHVYEPAQARFHMEAFVKNLAQRN